MGGIRLPFWSGKEIRQLIRQINLNNAGFLEFLILPDSSGLQLPRETPTFGAWFTGSPTYGPALPAPIAVHAGGYIQEGQGQDCEGAAVFDEDVARPLPCGPLLRGLQGRGRCRQGRHACRLGCWPTRTLRYASPSPRPGRTHPYRLHLGESERAVGLDGKPNFYWAYLKVRQIPQNAGPGYKPG